MRLSSGMDTNLHMIVQVEVGLSVQVRVTPS